MDSFDTVMDKLTKIFAFKYEVMTKDVSFIIRGKAVHILVDGKVKQSFSFKELHAFVLCTKNLEIIKGL